MRHGRKNTFVVYYDLEAKGWRTFHAENFLRAE
ncbi:SH3 beta-barrel fold-containing protein [Bacteroides caccae]|nr:SH3 beta-barrel fold-containing protein [Bacteroides caccae]